MPKIHHWDPSEAPEALAALGSAGSGFGLKLFLQHEIMFTFYRSSLAVVHPRQRSPAADTYFVCHQIIQTVLSGGGASQCRDVHRVDPPGDRFEDSRPPAPDWP